MWTIGHSKYISLYFFDKGNTYLWNLEKTEWIKYSCIGKPQTWTIVWAFLFSSDNINAPCKKKARCSFYSVLLKVCFTDLNYIHWVFSFFQMMMALKLLIMKKTYFHVDFLVLLALNIQFNIRLKQSIWKW